MRRMVVYGAVVLLLLWWGGSWLFGNDLIQLGAAPQITLTAVLSVGGSQADETYVVLGAPTISAAFIDQVLAAYRSPASGKGQALYDLGVHYGIDPVYALAFFWHESDFGTTGEARVTLSLGNERCIADRPCIDQERSGYAQMESWEDGFEHWYRLILYGYVRGQVTIPIVGHACTTVDEIVPVYAPKSDGNDVAAYIAAVKHAVDTWRKGQVRV